MSPVDTHPALTSAAATSNAVAHFCNKGRFVIMFVRHAQRPRVPDSTPHRAARDRRILRQMTHLALTAGATCMGIVSLETPAFFSGGGQEVVMAKKTGGREAQQRRDPHGVDKGRSSEQQSPDTGGERAEGGGGQTHQGEKVGKHAGRQHGGGRDSH
jgi:hypothetical protein